MHFEGMWWNSKAISTLQAHNLIARMVKSAATFLNQHISVREPFILKENISFSRPPYLYLNMFTVL
jgi:hypothetical protein